MSDQWVAAWLEAVVLGLYVPIILFSGSACYLFIVRLLVPAWRARRLDIEHYAVGISCAFALAAHFGEAIYYGVPRWIDEFDFWNRRLAFVGALKLLILASAVFAVAALNAAPSNTHNLRRVAMWAVLAWGFGVIAALAIAVP